MRRSLGGTTPSSTISASAGDHAPSTAVAAASRAHAADEATLFRVFLTDGSSIVTYGEFARVADQVVLSVPIGGTTEAPRLHAVTLAASRVDWEKTDRYAASTRYQRYVATRAEADFQQLTDEVAAVLSNIAQSTDRSSALATQQCEHGGRASFAIDLLRIDARLEQDPGALVTPGRRRDM